MTPWEQECYQAERSRPIGFSRLKQDKTDFQSLRECIFTEWLDQGKDDYRGFYSAEAKWDGALFDILKPLLAELFNHGDWDQLPIALRFRLIEIWARYGSSIDLLSKQLGTLEKWWAEELVKQVARPF